MSRRRTRAAPDWPDHRDDAPPSDDPRSLRRGLLAGASVMLLTVALLLAGPWSTQAGGTLLALGWIAAVGFGALAYRGRPPVVLTLTKLSVVLALVSLALALFLLFVGVQVREVLSGTVLFGSGGEGCTLEGDAETFAADQSIYQVAHLSRPVEAGEVVTLTMRLDGALVAEGSNPTEFAFDCLGTPLEPLDPGAYTVAVEVGSEVLAVGSFEVTPSSGEARILAIHHA